MSKMVELTVKFTGKELDIVKKAAARAGLSLSDWCAAGLRAAIAKEKMGTAVKAILKSKPPRKWEV